MLEVVNSAGGVVETLAGIGEVSGVDSVPADAITIPISSGQVFVSDLVDTVDIEKERSRLQQAVEKAQGRVQGLGKRLANPAYVEKAKPELVQETRDMLSEAEHDLEAAEEALRGLA